MTSQAITVLTDRIKQLESELAAARELLREINESDWSTYDVVAGRFEERIDALLSGGGGEDG